MSARTRTIQALAIAGLCFASAGAAWGQGVEVDRAPGGDDRWAPPAPATSPAEISDFLGEAGGTAPEEAAESGGGAEAINANYDATLDIYQNILDRQDVDTRWVDRRIQANEEILERYGPRLSNSEQRLRVLQVTFMNRALELKRERDAGALTPEAFAERIKDEEARYRKRKDRLREDVAYYRGEQTDAQARLQALQEQRQAVEREIALRTPATPPERAPGEELLDGIFQTLDQLSGFRVHLTMEGTDSLYRYQPLHPEAR